MKLTYIRWSMTVIETQGITIVTDPVFYMLGIMQAPKSYTFDRLPRPDLVFISHTHVDHFSPLVLKRLDPATPVWMPADKVQKASHLGLSNLRGLREWETDEFHGVRLTSVPALHTGGELGLVVEGDRTVYFAGDSALDRDLFRTIGHRWDLDAVLLPVGDLRVLGLSIGQLSPRKAPQALRLLREPRIVVPTHYSGMAVPPFLYFGGTPRKLAAYLGQAALGTVLGTTRPLESVEF
jgi:L-ascorbate metabolism protein UlaG (beta-lactamase superfamily)